MNWQIQFSKRKIIETVLLIIAVVILISLEIFTHQQSRRSIHTQTQSSGPYQVVGNKILDAQDNEHIFQGVTKPSLEWSAKGEHISEQELLILKKTLPRANIIRLPLNQTFWLSKDTGKEYQKVVRQTVNFVESTVHMDILLDLHSKGDGDDNQDHHLPNDESGRFWDEVAREYKNDPHVLFELYNEPVLPKNASPDVWLKGGKLEDGYTAIGMQELIDIIRGTGANNIIVANGINYGYDFTFDSKQLPLPQGKNIVFGSHPYNFAGKNILADWQHDFMFLNKHYPIMLTEFGDTQTCDGKYGEKLIDYATTNHISWIAWAWYPADDYCGFPSLIDKNSKVTPAGRVVQKELGPQQK